MSIQDFLGVFVIIAFAAFFWGLGYEHRRKVEMRKRLKELERNENQ